MLARLAFGPNGASRAAAKGRIVIIVDTLRASTTVTTILENGGRGVITTASIKEAKNIARSLSREAPENVILAGERRGLRIPGFDLGNSPLEFTREKVKGKIVILTTTNFTRTVQYALSAPLVLAGCLRNAEAVANVAKLEALKSGRKITVVHSGREGSFSPEDYITAHIIKCFIDGVKPPEHKECVLNSPSAKYLSSIGFQKDVEYCSELNTSNTVPVLKNKIFIKASQN